MMIKHNFPCSNKKKNIYKNYFDGPVTGSEPVITGSLRACKNNKNNGIVTGFQAVKCRYNER